MRLEIPNGDKLKIKKLRHGVHIDMNLAMQSSYGSGSSVDDQFLRLELG